MFFENLYTNLNTSREFHGVLWLFLSSYSLVLFGQLVKLNRHEVIRRMVNGNIRNS